MKISKIIETTFFSAALLLISCNVDIESSSASSVEKTKNPLESVSTSIINSYYATGKNHAVTVEWAPISSEYDVYITQKKIHYYTKYNSETKLNDPYYETDFEDKPIKITATDVNENGTPCKTFSGLTNMNEEEKLNECRYYAYTLSVYKNGELKEERTAEASAAGNFNFGDTVVTTGVWTRLNSSDSFIPYEANTKGTSNIKHASDGKFKIAKFMDSKGNATFVNLYNNPSAVTELVRASGYMETDDYKSYLSYLEEGEEIQWYTAYGIGYRIELYGKIVKTKAEQSGYNETTSLTLNTAVGSEKSIESLTDAYRVGTIIQTKGFYEENDGGESFYKISNRAAYTYGSIKTKAGQYANIVLVKPAMNIIQLGAGRCFQVTSAKAKDWHEYQVAKNAYNKAVKAGDSTCEKWENFKKTHSNWEAYNKNDDGARIAEANSLLKAYRKTKTDSKGNPTEDLSVHLSLYIPQGQYRIATAVNASIQNYTLTGTTNTRHITPEQIDSFESTFALGDESGSSNFNGTVLYTDNGSGCNHLNIYGPADNTVVEGITFESRETDSKRTYWYTSQDADGTKHGINFIGHGSLEKTMADEQWYSRQVMISQCQNVTIRNCEFIITSHIRDQAKFPSDWTAEKEDLYDFDYDGPEFLVEGDAHGNLYKNGSLKYYGYQANSYVEWCDLHTDKQFTNVTFYSGWKNVKVDNCLMYNMAAVFRGANLGYLDFYGEQCYNGTVNNCTLYHNCHDEQIGIFTLTTSALNFKADECIRGAYFTNNRVYTYRDEHVDEIKHRVMVFTVGYNDSKNITDVKISGNYFLLQDLPSKCFTFGGCPADGRDETWITGNTFDIVNGGGSYIFETTRSYVRINNNTFNYKVNPDRGYIGGTLVDARYPNDYEKYEMEFCNNTINCDGELRAAVFSTDGNKTNGKVNNNTFNIESNLGVPITGASECRNNTLNVKGRFRGLYNGRGTLTKDTVIDGNNITTLFNDSEDDYSLSQNEGGWRETGRQGYSFVTVGCTLDDGNFKTIISNNKVSAPNCTRMNKHFLRFSTYSKTENGITTTKHPAVFITNNYVQKYWYMRGMSDSNSENVVFFNNYNNYGNEEKLEDWYFPNSLADTENGLYTFLPDSNTYEVSKNYGVYKIPDYYDDGTHGKRPVSKIGKGVYKEKKWISIKSEFPTSLVEIDKEAFYNSSAFMDSLPENLQIIRKQAFYGCNSIGTNTKVWNKTTNHQDYKFVIPASVKILEEEAFYITDRKTTIYCEAESKPEGWADNWYKQYELNGINTIEVIWGYKNTQ